MYIMDDQGEEGWRVTVAKGGSKGWWVGNCRLGGRKEKQEESISWGEFGGIYIWSGGIGFARVVFGMRQ
jgi:hypothetical protein